MSENILEVKDLVIHYETDESVVEAVNNITITLEKGKVLGLVGETGAGKTTTAYGIMGLLPPKVGHVIQGSILLDGEDLLKKSEREMRAVRGKQISMIFQDPMTALNPVKTVGEQIAEVVYLHDRCSKADALKRAQDMLAMVGIGRDRYKDYPHQFSGGMKQRIVIAIALACKPDLLIADEPTTALDVTIQAQILDLLREIQMKLGTATILVSHDLGVVARVADRVAVMYAGKIVEIGTAEEVYYDPRHPYTWGLMRSLPAFANGKESLYTIPGMPPTLIDPPKGDAFACRNEYALNIDYEEMPPMFKITDTHYAATWLLDPRAPQIKSPVGGTAHE